MIRRAVSRAAGPLFTFLVLASIGLVIGMAIIGRPTP
ncbi:hypothetical protein PBI_PAEDORE_50 [Streptomyces phage Paedore]|uniref:Uncharacterized protein n=1 Tax=Streptomyces phage Paedore TaxID=2108134 RepID=A0A2P1JTS2_9CAUD|nr:hypothetical protein KGG91_gp50 [Streptomyces phage Paedore]AVO22533.1 hypothetical protein PBI_PAEDORE_50 [Streptomyces phage Paedore]